MSEHEITRRQVLGGGLVVAAGLGVGPRMLEAAPAPLQIPRRVLGKTGEKIPILLMGGSLPLDPRFDPKLAEGFRYGANYIDAADCYSGGACEPAVGAFHTRANLRSKIWITSKSDKHDPKGFEETFART
jgi:predicted aldo/keto reductase-like oxidoreductase